MEEEGLACMTVQHLKDRRMMITKVMELDIFW